MYFTCIWKVQLQREGATDKKVVHPPIHFINDQNSQRRSNQSQQLLLGPTHGYRSTGTWAIFCCFHRVKARLDWIWSTQDTSQSIWDADTAGKGSTCNAMMPATGVLFIIPLLSQYFKICSMSEQTVFLRISSKRLCFQHRWLQPQNQKIKNSVTDSVEP